MEQIMASKIAQLEHDLRIGQANQDWRRMVAPGGGRSRLAGLIARIKETVLPGSAPAQEHAPKSALLQPGRERRSAGANG
jgi:hypothetical protein